MPKFEYEIINRDQAERVEWVGDLFNEMGSNGWKLCVVSDWFFGFEREIVEPPPVGHRYDAETDTLILKGVADPGQ